MLRYRQKQRAASGVRGKKPEGAPKSSVWTFRTCKRKALQVPDPLKSNKKKYYSGLTLSPMETKICLGDIKGSLQTHILNIRNLFDKSSVVANVLISFHQWDFRAGVRLTW